MLEITKDIAKDLREARALSVRRDRAGSGAMTLHFEDNVRGETVRTHKNWLVETTLHSYQCKDYNDGKIYIESDPQDSPCYGSVDLYHHGYHADSVIGQIKVGDHIRFEFVGNAGNIHCGKAGLHFDQLKIVIHRGEDRSRKVFEFILDYSINPGDSARMVNPSGNFARTLIDQTSNNYQNREVSEEQKEA